MQPQLQRNLPVCRQCWLLMRGIWTTTLAGSQLAGSYAPSMAAASAESPSNAAGRLTYQLHFKARHGACFKPHVAPTCCTHFARVLSCMQSAYADVQQQVYEELQQAGLATRPNNSSSGREFAPSDLNSLPLLSAVIKEALRLCTPVPFGCSRLVTEQGGAELCGHHVPKVSCLLSWFVPACQYCTRECSVQGEPSCDG